MSASPLTRRLPAVGRLLSDPALVDIVSLYGRDAVTVQARRHLAELRGLLTTAGAGDEPGADFLDRRLERLAGDIAGAVKRELGGLRRVINATGIFIHTNLGRAPLAAEVVAELIPLLTGYCDLEMDLGSGRRADRNRRLGALARAVCGAPAALLTNNNAAALVLVLSTLASGRDVLVSRGELVEIGGSFRIPDILESAGARLVEVGTTNRTRLDDYRRAISEQTALLLKVHPSNYRIVGFTESVAPRDLARLGQEAGIPVLVDEGSGLLGPSERPQLRDHSSLSQLLGGGCDLVCGSGDKLLGGPQAGLLLGRRDLVERCRRHPLYRALRPDIFAFAAIEAVLRRKLAGDETPMARLWPDPERLGERLGRLAERLGGRLVDADAFLGGGAAPERPIAGKAVAIDGSERLLAALRAGEPAVVAYLRDQRLVLDLRTVEPADDGAVAESVLRAREVIA